MTAAALETVRQSPEQTPQCASYRSAMRHVASGVSLITHGEGAARTGLTATSVSSLSVDPPTLLVCLPRAAALCAGLAVGERFGVSVLAAGQAEFADRFAETSGIDEAERFDEGNWAPTPGGASVLADAVAVFECVVEELILRHAHAIVIGRVRLATPVAQCGALVHWRGAYDQVGWSAQEVSCVTGGAPRDHLVSSKIRLVSQRD